MHAPWGDTRFSIFDWAPAPFVAIVWRDLLITLRQYRYGAILLGLAALLLFINLRNLVAMALWSITPAMVVTTTLTVQCGALLAIIFLVLPALAAVTLAAERQQKTEDLLYTALFRPATVVLGKLLAVLAIFVLFHLALMPLGAFIYFFAGIEIESFFQVTFVLYATALCHTLIGLLVSRTVERSSRAVLLAYALIALLYLTPFAVHLNALSRGTGPAAALAVRPPDPVMLVSNLLAATAGWRECGKLLAFQLYGTLTFAALCFTSTGIQRLARGWWRTAAGCGGRAVRPRPPIPNWGNPMYHKDRRTTPAARPLPALGLFLLAAVSSYAFNQWSLHALGFSTTALEVGAVVLYVLIPFLVIESCSREMAPSTLTLLRLTRLGSDRVITGKALAVLHTVTPVVLGILAGTAAFVTYIDPQSVASGRPAGVPLELLMFKGLMLGPKAALAVALCFMVVRFRAPGPADLAACLVASGVLVALGEAVGHGLFESMIAPDMGSTRIAVLAAGQLLSMSFSAIIIFAIAQMRFEAVFDEGSDVYAISHVDRRNF